MTAREQRIATFFFSDIEGSTSLLKAVGESYPDVLEAHRRIVRDAVQTHGGRELGTEGDSFFVEFATPKHALLCARDVQLGLAQNAWPSGHVVRVRIGVDTGTTWTGPEPTGASIHRAARICSAAHGGQVLVSHAAMMLFKDQEEEVGIELLDVGEYRLKDFPNAVRLYQLAATGLPRDFPEPRAAPDRVLDDWIPRLNRLLAPAAEVKGLVREPPKLLVADELRLSPEQRALAARVRRELKKNHLPNQHVAVVENSPVWQDEPVRFNARIAEYASVRALELSTGTRLTKLSANALLVCGERQELIVHRRSDEDVSHYYANRLHTHGGAYNPPHRHGQDFDHYSLLRTAMRETSEESGVNFVVPPYPPMLLTVESDIGFINLGLLGVSITRQAAEDAEESTTEGVNVRVHFEDLQARLEDETDWVPSGRAQVLAWLALGAPLGSDFLRFGSYSGPELFDEIVPK